jgi:hypothetical protein
MASGGSGKKEYTWLQTRNEATPFFWEVKSLFECFEKSGVPNEMPIAFHKLPSP